MYNLRKMIIIMGVSLLLVGCNKSNNDVALNETSNKMNDVNDSDILSENNDGDKNEVNESVKKENLIEPSGTTLETRIKVPSGYERTASEEGSFAYFVRNYSMKEDGSKVLLYNGNEKGNQGAHVAVFNLPIENYDLQQCADSIMRMYAEYYYNTKQYDKISFHFVSGFEAKFSKWRQGYNIAVSGNSVSWRSDSSCNDSYESFKKYMRMVFNYASTLSMEKESTRINEADIQIGDVFLKGGSPGHVVMVVDVCVNSEGKKAFLLAQGFMPAQEFHVLKNEASEDGVWYYEEDISYPFSTPEYTFDEGSLRRLDY
jgi:hypothetical protein